MVRDRDRVVGWWLLVATLLLFGMIVLGGVTRLTRSGLSITTWDPITGVLPPLDDDAWRDAYARYQASPEGRLVATDLDLVGFRHIFLVEWSHRLLGRFIAVWTLIPFAYFAWKKRLPAGLVRRVAAVVALGAAQGVLGWIMVASGLVDVPHVSPYRLTAHFLVGVLLFAAVEWSALDVLAPSRARIAAPRAVRATTAAVVASVVAALGWGGLMAGHHAGLVFADFPTMGGSLNPLSGRALTPTTFVADGMAVHFTHRLLATIVAIAVVALLVTTRSPAISRRARNLAIVLVAVVALQITLGALTVLHHVPIVLASAHQATAIALVAVAVAFVHDLIPE